MHCMRTRLSIVPLFGALLFLHSIPNCVYEPTTPRGQGESNLWTPQISGTSNTLHDVWGTSETDVWAVGDNGTILHWDGEAWRRSADLGEERINGIWGSPAGDVWAVGDTIRRWTGDGWHPVATPPGPFTLHEVWGRGPDDVYAVGSNGLILHYDGVSWAQMASGTRHDLYALGGTDEIVYAAGERGLLLGLAGGACCVLLWDASGRTDIDFTGMARMPGGELLFAGGPCLYRWDGNCCERWIVSGLTWFRDVAARPGGMLYAAGEGGDCIRRCAMAWNGIWTPMEMTGRHRIFALWGSDEGDCFAVGSNGSILYLRDRTTTAAATRRSSSTIASVTR